MVGYRVERKPNGIIIYKDSEEIHLTQDESNKLASLIWLAQRKYWKATLVVVSTVGKRGPKKGNGGRPRKRNTALRRYWRKHKHG